MRLTLSLLVLVSSGEWSCWSDFSSCSMSCGQGLKVRQRTCQSTKNGHSYNVHCKGNNMEEQPCEMPACTGKCIKCSMVILSESIHCLSHSIL